MTSNGDQSPPAGSEGIDSEAVAEGSTTEAPRARLTRLKINRFRNVKPGTELRFDNGINVLLGRNGTGKTTLLELITAAVTGDLRAYEEEDFDIEFVIRIGELAVDVWMKNTLSLLDPGAAGRLPNNGSGLSNWSYRVVLGSVNGESLAVTSTSEKAWIESREGEPREIHKVSLFLFSLCHLVQALIASNIAPTSAHIRDVVHTAFDAMLPIGGNCFRLDEGLDIFRQLTRGERISRRGIVSSIRFHSTGISSDVAVYTPTSLYQSARAQGDSVHEKTQLELDHRGIAFLERFIALTHIRSMRLTMSLLERKRTMNLEEPESQFSRPAFWFTTHRGVTLDHESLSYGEKRLLAFLYHAAANPQILVADELVNGMHYEWIEACLGAIQGQAFLTSQNPLLLDHLPFDSAEEVQRRFILCDRDEHGDWIWRNMDDDAADAFYRAYEVGIQHVSGILRTKGLW